MRNRKLGVGPQIGFQIIPDRLMVEGRYMIEYECQASLVGNILNVTFVCVF